MLCNNRTPQQYNAWLNKQKALAKDPKANEQSAAQARVDTANRIEQGELCRATLERIDAKNN
jgi:type V secretory pathway adhesin AidA